jgi:hypothetical protein
VAPGDTLWSIASKFLKDPYRWADLWKLNADEIKNPQRIYPGQVISLDKSAGQPRLKLATINRAAPRVCRIHGQGHSGHRTPGHRTLPQRAARHRRQRLRQRAAHRRHRGQPRSVRRRRHDLHHRGQGQHKLWQIFRPGKALVDPDTGDTLGVEAVFLGNARQTGSGVPASFKIGISRMEILTNDLLLPAPRQDVPSYIPRPPERRSPARYSASTPG